MSRQMPNTQRPQTNGNTITATTNRTMESHTRNTNSDKNNTNSNSQHQQQPSTTAGSNTMHGYAGNSAYGGGRGSNSYSGNDSNGVNSSSSNHQNYNAPQRSAGSMSGNNDAEMRNRMAAGNMMNPGGMRGGGGRNVNANNANFAMGGGGSSAAGGASSMMGIDRSGSMGGGMYRQHHDMNVSLSPSTGTTMHHMTQQASNNFAFDLALSSPGMPRQLHQPQQQQQQQQRFSMLAGSSGMGNMASREQSAGVGGSGLAGSGSGMMGMRGGNASPNYQPQLQQQMARDMRAMGGMDLADGRRMKMNAGASAAGGGGPTSLSEAEREEELLLNLLIARRQRAMRSGGNSLPVPNSPARTGPGGDPLRRSLPGETQQQHPGDMGMAPRNPSLSSMPGLPPLYAEATNTLPGDGPDQRIDRAPKHLMDARTSQEMMMMQQQQHREYIMGFHKRGAGAAFGDAASGGPMNYHMGPQGPQGHAGHGLETALHSQMGGMDAAQPSKKKRHHKKKPADMPRRPLSAYNLFFSEERERILKEIEAKEPKEEGKEEGEEAAAPRNNEEAAAATAAPEEEASKPKALMRPLIPNQKKRRPHRKTHGKISFQQLARMVGERWKALADDKRKYYQNLAQEDMKRQKIAMEEYYAKQQSATASAGKLIGIDSLSAPMNASDAPEQDNKPPVDATGAMPVPAMGDNADQ